MKNLVQELCIQDKNHIVTIKVNQRKFGFIFLKRKTTIKVYKDLREICILFIEHPPPNKHVPIPILHT